MQKKPLTRGIEKCGRKGKNKDRYRMYALQILRYMPKRLYAEAFFNQYSQSKHQDVIYDEIFIYDESSVTEI